MNFQKPIMEFTQSDEQGGVVLAVVGDHLLVSYIKHDRRMLAEMVPVQTCAREHWLFRAAPAYA